MSLNLKVVARHVFRNYKGKVFFYKYNWEGKTDYWNTFTLKFHVCSSLDWIMPKYSCFLEGAYNLKIKKNPISGLVRPILYSFSCLNCYDYVKRIDIFRAEWNFFIMFSMEWAIS